MTATTMGQVLALLLAVTLRHPCATAKPFGWRVVPNAICAAREGNQFKLISFPKNIFLPKRNWFDSISFPMKYFLRKRNGLFCANLGQGYAYITELLDYG